MSGPVAVLLTVALAVVSVRAHMDAEPEMLAAEAHDLADAMEAEAIRREGE